MPKIRDSRSGSRTSSSAGDSDNMSLCRPTPMTTGTATCATIGRPAVSSSSSSSCSSSSINSSSDDRNVRPTSGRVSLTPRRHGSGPGRPATGVSTASSSSSSSSSSSWLPLPLACCRLEPLSSSSSSSSSSQSPSCPLKKRRRRKNVPSSWSSSSPSSSSSSSPFSSSSLFFSNLVPSLVWVLLIASAFLSITDACSSRSTPKPRPPLPTLRPNITFQTYACPEAYAKWYCLNGATCFSVRIGESILYNCECADGYMGQRCEFKDLDGSYLRKSS